MWICVPILILIRCYIEVIVNNTRLAGLMSDMTCSPARTRVSPAFSRHMVTVFVVYGALCVSIVLNTVILLVLGFRTRRRLVSHLHELYFKHRAFYNIQHRVTDADQRMTADAANMVDAVFGSVSPPIVPIIVDLVMPFAYMIVPAIAMGKYAPVAAIPLACATVTLCMIFLTSIPMGIFTRRLEAAEGGFRYQLAHTVEHAESIAFHRGEAQENATAKVQLRNVLREQTRFILVAIVPQFFNTLVENIMIRVIYFSVIPYVVSRGESFQHVFLMAQLSLIIARSSPVQLITMLRRLMPAIGSMTRLGEMEGELQRLGKRDTDTTADSLVKSEYQGMGDEMQPLTMDGLTVATPTGVILVDGLTLTVPQGKSLLIAGPSGAGKSSVLRTLAGLWPAGRGGVALPADSMFLPQTAYLVPGTLAEQVAYPKKVEAADTQAMEQALRDVDLGHLLDVHSIDSVAPWADILSGGEQQRLGFARLFFHSPAWAVMDEATSALDGPLEHRLLTECTERGITLISVAHRPSVTQFHDLALDLAKDHSYEVAQLVKKEE